MCVQMLAGDEDRWRERGRRMRRVEPVYVCVYERQRERERGRRRTESRAQWQLVLITK